MDHARQWATRITHEAQLHEENSFLTLTYSDSQLPVDHGVSKREFQLFMKRLRDHLDRTHNRQVRFFGCGEYGEGTQRPHYHLILFGHAFYEDRKPFKRARGGDLLYQSPSLEKIWGLGFCLIGDVTHESAGYVARYQLKKGHSWRTGERYQRVNPETGEAWKVEPEFLVMSRMPGIGAGWWEKYKSEVFPADFVVIGGQKHPVPNFYRQRALKDATGLVSPLHNVDQKRRANARQHASDQTIERRKVRDEVAHLRIKQWIRDNEQ